jgi:DNA-binding transcriptional MerR regulator
MSRGGLSIGQAADETGIKVPTIRYYEQIGLLRALPRSDGNRRLYDAADVRRLRFIRHARELGFEIEPIRTLLALQDRPDQSCAECDNVARARLADVETRLAKLLSLRSELERMIESCSHGRVAECRVIETLADHALCESPGH